MNNREDKISSELIYEGKVVKLVKDKVLCSNGVTSFREVIHHNGGAAILFINDKDEVMLIRQFRYAYNEVLYEIPAGKLEKNEDPYDAAKREFEEETGSITDNLEYLTTIYPTCGYTNEKIYLYLALDYKQGNVSFDEDEYVETIFIPLSKVLDMIKNNEINDAKTICAIMTYLILKNRIKL